MLKVPNETFKAAAHLVVSGKKRKNPNVKIILAHMGGSTPFLAARVAVLSRHMGCPLTHDEILKDFSSFYYETALSAHETTLAAMDRFVTPDHILFGTDFPGKRSPRRSTDSKEGYTDVRLDCMQQLSALIWHDGIPKTSRNTTRMTWRSWMVY